MIYKLRNPGGIESWFTETEAAELLAQEGWSKVDEQADEVFDTPVADPAPSAPAESAPEPVEDAPKPKKSR